MRTRKTVVTILSILILLVSAVCLVACGLGQKDTGSTEDTPVSISVASLHKGDYVIGQGVDFSEITVVVTYSSGAKTETVLSDVFLDEENREKFFTEGIHSIFVRYGELETVFQISVINPDEIVLYKAQFYSNGGTKVPVMYADVITAFIVPEREGYTFEGWYASYDLSGSLARTPYRLTHDTDFYAKWRDNRSCRVTFYDEGEIFSFRDDKGTLHELDFYKEYGTSINLDDKESYPDPSEKEGKIFKMWRVSAGNVENIVEDVRIEAVYESVRIFFGGKAARFLTDLASVLAAGAFFLFLTEKRAEGQLPFFIFLCYGVGVVLMRLLVKKTLRQLSTPLLLRCRVAARKKIKEGYKNLRSAYANAKRRSYDRKERKRTRRDSGKDRTKRRSRGTNRLGQTAGKGTGGKRPYQSPAQRTKERRG